MAIKKNCGACQELQDYAPNFVQNGVTDTECNSLKNNTGLNPSLSDKHKDCDDLKDINDCFIGNMADIVDAFDTCDWKEFMKRFIPNEYSFNYAMVCAICGMWEKIEKLECLVNFLFKGYAFKFGEAVKKDVSHVVAGKGVSFALVSDKDAHSSDIYLSYISGGLVIGGGSVVFHTGDFKDEIAVLNLDDGSKVTNSIQRSGNSAWNTTGSMASLGELIYEVCIKKSEYPQIKSLHAGVGQATGGGGYQVAIVVFKEGEYAYGQHGGCDRKTGKADQNGFDDGHKVPEGWIYVQVRMRYIMAMKSDGKYTPKYWMGIKFNQDSIEC